MPRIIVTSNVNIPIPKPLNSVVNCKEEDKIDYNLRKANFVSQNLNVCSRKNSGEELVQNDEDAIPQSMKV